MLHIFSLKHYLQGTYPEPGALSGSLCMFFHYGGGNTYLPFTHEEIDSE